MATDISAGGRLRIDLTAIIDNYRLIQTRVAPARVAAVVKANAYGLGAVEVAHTLCEAGCMLFFVAHLVEALELRPHLPNSVGVYILNGLQPGGEAICEAAGAIPVLNSLDQIKRWSGRATSSGRALPAVLQVDTGMARLGLAPDEVETLANAPHLLNGIDLLMIMSHLACGDEPEADTNGQQMAAFATFADRFPGVPRSLDNSGGAFQHRPEHYDVVRAGIALYGGSPHPGSANPMRPVVSLDARIVQTRQIPGGTGVGYGLSYRADASVSIATIAVGYADGWPRRLGNIGAAYIGDRRAPIVGRVSMDSITLDVTGVPDDLVRPGATVELLGPHQSIDDVAADAETISYEILSQLGRRFARTYVPARWAASPRSTPA